MKAAPMTLEQREAFDKLRSRKIECPHSYLFNPSYGDMTCKNCGLPKSSIEGVADAWSAIESAPFDGTKFLAITREGIQRVDYYNAKNQGKWFKGQVFWNEKSIDRYTHWMPLPQPPAKDQS